MPGGKNPAATVDRYKEPAPEIRHLTLAQIDEQLTALAHYPQIQTMVATLIYAGLRRAELLWLTRDDVKLPKGTPGLIHVRDRIVAMKRSDGQEPGRDRPLLFESGGAFAYKGGLRIDKWETSV